MRYRVAGALLAGAALCAPAAALEDFATYDSFSLPAIDAGKWASSERTRVLRNSALNMIQRDWGGTGSDAGINGQVFTTPFNRPGPISQIRAQVRVDAVEATGCAANPSVSRARARLLGSFFNVGTPVAGNSTGDVLGQVYLMRTSDSTDPPGVLQAIGLVIVCQDATCAASRTVGSPVSLGTVALGDTATLRMEWDRAGNRFDFGMTTAAGSMAGSVPYTLEDDYAPGAPGKSVGTRTDTANCQSGPRTTALINAVFDTVEFNRSATR
jgi:hypothetical protein